MKRMGIIGGLGPEATIEYYRRILSTYREQYGRSDYPEIVIYSLDLERCMHMAEAKQWESMAAWLVAAVRALHRAGADLALIAAGTPHIVFDEVRAASPIPMLSIVEETGKVASQLGLRRLGLMGTLFTMQSDMFQRVLDKENVQVVVPDARDQQYIHDKLRTEIALGQIVEGTRLHLQEIIRKMVAQHAIQGVILGCTELPLILGGEECGIPCLDAARIHIDAALRYCLTAA